jgi:hypothetical protein
MRQGTKSLPRYPAEAGGFSASAGEHLKEQWCWPVGRFLRIEVSSTSLRRVPMSTDAISPLRQRMIEDMSARKLNPHTQRSHISSCKRFAAYLKRLPDTATADEIRLFQLHLTETGASICNRNRIMTGLRFLFRVTPRRFPPSAFGISTRRTGGGK